ncbi:cytochrome P450 4C1-like [Anopheles nili]|uniref:cytochrome P450 4C1-like n=1 Tax=Anopheles nili TaxID=185578 RepID=UPI00237ABA72|nr:cytochrome P450 4C1-like [Anopheles nili]
MLPVGLIQLVLVALTLVPVVRWFQKRFQMSSVLDKIPGPKAYPIVGSMYPFIGKKSEEIFYIIDQRTRAYPGIHRIWNGSTPEVRINRAEYVEKLLSSSRHIEKSAMYKFLSAWLGQGLLTSKDDRWFQHRRLITPTFHFNILDGFCEVFAEHSAQLVNQLAEVAQGDRTPVNVYPFITRAALDIICETAMGVKVHAQTSGRDNPYVAAVYDLSAQIQYRVVRPWLHPDFVWNRSRTGRQYREALEQVHGYASKVIRERRAELQHNRAGIVEPTEGRKRRLAFLDMLLESTAQSGVGLSDDDVREEVDTFMFEGHDTTAAGMSWALFLLALHPEVQDRVQQEIDSIFAGSDRPATMRDLNEMRLLERCLKETLRLYPSVSFFGRTLSEDVTFGGYHVPSGTIVGVHAYHVHRDERYFPDAERFDPDRFLPENTEKRHPYAYIPFSAGPRNCIGQKFALLEEKSVVSAILRRFRVRSVRTREEQLIQHELITRPKDGIELYLIPRDVQCAP